jgi:hypothetical protein
MRVVRFSLLNAWCGEYDIDMSVFRLMPGCDEYDVATRLCTRYLLVSPYWSLPF